MIVLKEDRSVVAIAHLSQLLDFITCIGGFIVPLIMWLTQRDRLYAMDEHGKSILNFQLSMFIYGILCIPMILLLGLGVLGLIVIGVLTFIFPIINAIRASNGDAPYYPLSIKFL